MGLDAARLATTIRERRRALGLTQEALADLADCSPRFLRELERAKPGVRLDKVLAVLDALGLELRTDVAGDRA